MSDEFFVGYLPMPEATGRRMRRIALALVTAGALVAVALAVATGPFDASSFEYAKETSWQGTVELKPAPVLIVVQKEAGTLFGRATRYPLVAPGKHGAAPLLEGLDGVAITTRAKRIVRGATTMLELVPESIHRYAPQLPADGTPMPATDVEDLGAARFTGEIVDSKCFLGVMNPGRLEVHRACAKRCIAGGVPPMLAAHGADGREAHLLLVDPAGKPFGPEILPLVGQTVTMEGRLERRDELFYFYTSR